jgi:methylphosphotriester-DNA--protein-cysteine methyltransferase
MEQVRTLLTSRKKTKIKPEAAPVPDRAMEQEPALVQLVVAQALRVMVQEQVRVQQGQELVAAKEIQPSTTTEQVQALEQLILAAVAQELQVAAQAQELVAAHRAVVPVAVAVQVVNINNNSSKIEKPVDATGFFRFLPNH